ncbi:hypothetical protein MACK_001094 [Theileria orientalis]|uniref:Uncharacterized protein n=1 Tax=Theileria orientalis TaxID=68886 RepID=A0A976MCC6_THEOR|nr:hypothetical protein MACK_001094 [Theileria orientalis]
MAIFNFIFKSGLYIIEQREVTVKKEDCAQLGYYHKLIHVIKKPHPMTYLEIWNDAQTIIMYLTEEYETNFILFLVFYVSNNDPERPLIVEVWMKDHSVRRYSYSEMVQKNYTSITGLTELSNNLAKELKDELYKIGGRITFIVDKAEDYKDMKVKKEPTTDENFIMITHSPQCEFKSSTLTCSNLCNLMDYMSNDYDSRTLKGIVVYFYVQDKNFKVPLLVALEPTEDESPLNLEYWTFSGMDGLRKKYTILSRSKSPIVNYVNTIYGIHENEINWLITRENLKYERCIDKKETGSTEESNELYETQVSLKHCSKKQNGQEKKSGVGLFGVIVLVILSFFLVGSLVTVTTYKYYKKYKGYYGKY